MSRAGDDPVALEAACQLYQGDFLADFEVRNAPAFDDWAAGERQRIREAALAAMRRLVDLLQARADSTEAALRATLRLLALDPLQEHAHRVLMRLHVRQGRPAAALNHFHQLRETLSRELRVEPEPATQELFRDIGRARRTPDRRGGTPGNEPPRRESLEEPPEQERPPSFVAPHRARRAANWIIAGIGLLAALAAILLFVRPAASPPEVARVFPVSTGLVMSGRPALSPDGSRLVFTARPQGSSNVDLYVMTLGDRQPVRLTSDPAVDDNAAWSPDGTSIGFVRIAPGGTGPCRIYVMSVPAGAERAAGRCASSASTTLAWSRDGADIYFSDQAGADSPHSLRVLSVRTGTARAITNPPADSFGDRHPAVSRDGRRVAFVRDAAGRSSDLFVLDVGSGDLSRLTSEGGAINGLAWSSDDAGLFYSSDRAGDAGLWWIAAAGGETHRIAAGLLDYRRVSHASDRPLLVFEAVRDRSELRRAVSNRAPLAALDPMEGLASDSRDTFPDLGPHGALVFVSTRSGHEQLWLSEPGRPPRQLTQFDGWRLSDPRCSPDGRHIAFVASSGGSTDIYLIRREGGAPARLTSDPAEDAAPGWSPNGRALYFGSRRGGASRIWRMEPFSPDRAAVPVSQPGPGDLRVDPKGRWIAYLYPGRPGIWRRALAADGRSLVGPEQRLVSDFAPMDWTNWALTAEALF